ncbi:MAG: MoaD/ThiS family protein [Crocinitomicaceae bacterium]|jgi:molybdopterin synthase sulfur carrier subunit|nr:MoaD/ThiS family protein [Crocinitomicaceae bacterium]MBK9592710.1 MoaD/ThiS family protein [Crocinitomicaceae bacterium]
MKITLKYFGMIAESLAKQEEELSMEKSQTVSDLRDQLEKIYPKLKSIDYRIAVNQSLVESNYSIQQDSEVALLPPFAGG